MSDTLQTVLAEAISGLAEFFGTTTDTVMANLPNFLATYGWYATISDLPWDIFFCTLPASLILLILFGFHCGILEKDVKHPYAIIFGVYFTIVLMVIITNIALCIIAPEIIGMEALASLIKRIGG